MDDKEKKFMIRYILEAIPGIVISIIFWLLEYDILGIALGILWVLLVFDRAWLYHDVIKDLADDKFLQLKLESSIATNYPEFDSYKISYVDNGIDDFRKINQYGKLEFEDRDSGYRVFYHFLLGAAEGDEICAITGMNHNQGEWNDDGFWTKYIKWNEEASLRKVKIKRIFILHERRGETPEDRKSHLWRDAISNGLTIHEHIHEDGDEISEEPNKPLLNGRFIFDSSLTLNQEERIRDGFVYVKKNYKNHNGHSARSIASLCNEMIHDHRVDELDNVINTYKTYITVIDKDTKEKDDVFKEIWTKSIPITKESHEDLIKFVEGWNEKADPKKVQIDEFEKKWLRTFKIKNV